MERGVPLGEIDEHIQLTLWCLLSPGKRAEEADLCHAELCAQGRYFDSIFFRRGFSSAAVRAPRASVHIL